MSPTTAQTLTTICLIGGTFLLAIEALGRERAVRIESGIQKGALFAEQIFASVILLLTAPWKKLGDFPAFKREQVEGEDRWRLLMGPRWVGPGFLILACLSLIIFRLATNRYGESVVMIVCISSWFVMILSGVLTISFINRFHVATEARHSLLNKLKLLLLSGGIAVMGVLFAVTMIITFLSSWPAAIIFLFYVAIYIVATIIRRVIDFRVRYNLGNILILLGLLLAISGIVLQHLISTGVFQR